MTTDRQAQLNRLYQQFQVDGETAAFVCSVSRHYTISTLERLAEFGSRADRRAATHALGLIGDFSVNGSLGRRLNDPDRGVRLLAERMIRDIWCRDSSAAQRRHLQIILRLNAARESEAAIAQASALLTAAPDFAEAWHQRGIAHAALLDFRSARQDFWQALELNPYHFDAAVGLGQCALEAKKSHAALRSFRRALRLNPNLESVRAQVWLLRKALEGR